MDFASSAAGEGEGEGEGAPAADGEAAGQGPAPGTLTAGAWDDNLNFDLFEAWFAARAQELPGAPQLTTQEQEAAHARFGQRAAHARLDVALVVDVTGSMGDELDYLKVEIDAIAAAVDDTHPNADLRWSLISYQDEGDTYVTRVRDFTTLANLRAELDETSLGGGGDYPESVEDALEDTVGLGWRAASDVARLAFWIADAPHHDGEAARVTEALRAAAAADIHLYPIAASGTDALAEVTMRAAAQLTGGRYLFLTDDSGVGGAHAEPSIPCYFVTTLADAMVRMVDIEMSGAWHEPTAEEVIRTGGDPQDGRCVLDDGTEVAVF